MPSHRIVGRLYAATAFVGSAFPLTVLAHGGHGAPVSHMHLSPTVVWTPGLSPAWLLVAALAAWGAGLIWRTATQGRK